jgi:hypothetical protein
MSLSKNLSCLEVRLAVPVVPPHQWDLLAREERI